MMPHSIPAVESRTYYRADIDVLRGIAVISVVLYHLFPQTINSGFLGVDIFFVISGYVVTQALVRNLSLNWRVWIVEFYARRIKRILPALYFNVILTAIAVRLLIPPSDLSSIFKTAGAAVVGVSNIALLYARFDYFNPELAYNPFIQTWSLGVEEQFYLVFPLLLMLVYFFSNSHWIRRATIFFASISLLSLLYWVWLQYTAPVASFYSPLPRFWELLSGSLLALNSGSDSRPFDGKGWRLSRVLLASALLFMLMQPSFSISGVTLINVTVVAVTSALILFGTGNSRARYFSLLLAPLIWCGRLSYSLYLWHYSILTLFRWNGDLNKPSNQLLSIFLIFAVSILSYRFVEIRFRYSSLSNWKTIFFGGFSAISVLLILAALYFLPPSAIYLGRSESHTKLWPPADAPLAKSLSGSQRECHLEYLDSLRPDIMDRCSSISKESSNFYLIGNSLTQHYVPMIDAVSRQLGTGYTALTISSCRMTSAVQTIQALNFKYDLCRQYFEFMTDVVRRSAKFNDFVLIGSRSILPQPSKQQASELSGIFVGAKELTRGEAYEKMIQDWTSFANELRQRGISLIFIGPTPAFLIPGSKCVPEWFRADDAQCRVLKETLLEETTDLQNFVSLVAPRNGYLWLPSNELCMADWCKSFAEGKLLFRDQIHLSLAGSESLAAGFIRFLRDVRPQGG